MDAHDADRQPAPAEPAHDSTPEPAEAARAAPATTDPSGDAAGSDAATPDGLLAVERPDRDHVRLVLHVSRSRAYDAYVRGFGSWWQLARTPRTALHVEQHAGGAILEHAPGGHESRWGEVLEIEVGSRIRHSYRHAPERLGTVTAEFRDGEHGGAVVDVRHEPWDGDEDEHARVEEAWRQALRRFVADASAV